MNVSRETRARLEVFEREFLRWNARTNLSANVHEAADLTHRHVADSLQLAELGRGKIWVDIGTGGGFPGAVLAATFQGTERRVTMVESNNKKAAFLRHVCLAMGVEAMVLAERAEVVVGRIEPPDVVSARAVASLSKLLQLTERWLGRGTVGLFPKGRHVDDEIDEARAAWDFDLVRHPSRTADDATILEVSRLRPKKAAKLSDG